MLRDRETRKQRERGVREDDKDIPISREKEGRKETYCVVRRRCIEIKNMMSKVSYLKLFFLMVMFNRLKSIMQVPFCILNSNIINIDWKHREHYQF